VSEAGVLIWASAFYLLPSPPGPELSCSRVAALRSFCRPSRCPSWTSRSRNYQARVRYSTCLLAIAIV
jgi:hypothetical protein